MYVVLFCVILCVFFFKQKTAYEMRISDWSSDVCSSDLIDLQNLHNRRCSSGRPEARNRSWKSRGVSSIHAIITDSNGISLRIKISGSAGETSSFCGPKIGRAHV